MNHLHERIPGTMRYPVQAEIAGNTPERLSGQLHFDGYEVFPILYVQSTPSTNTLYMQLYERDNLSVRIGLVTPYKDTQLISYEDSQGGKVSLAESKQEVARPFSSLFAAFVLQGAYSSENLECIFVGDVTERSPTCRQVNGELSFLGSLSLRRSL